MFIVDCRSVFLLRCVCFVLVFNVVGWLWFAIVVVVVRGCVLCVLLWCVAVCCVLVVVVCR